MGLSYNECVERLVFTGGHHTSALEVAKALKDNDIIPPFRWDGILSILLTSR